MCFSRDEVAGTRTISQQAVAEKIVAKFGVRETDTPQCLLGLKLEDSHPDDSDVDEPLSDPIWLANNTHQDISNTAVRAAARYSQASETTVVLFLVLWWADRCHIYPGRRGMPPQAECTAMADMMKATFLRGLWSIGCSDRHVGTVRWYSWIFYYLLEDMI